MHQGVRDVVKRVYSRLANVIEEDFFNLDFTSSHMLLVKMMGLLLNMVMNTCAVTLDSFSCLKDEIMSGEMKMKPDENERLNDCAGMFNKPFEVIIVDSGELDTYNNHGNTAFHVIKVYVDSTKLHLFEIPYNSKSGQVEMLGSDSMDLFRRKLNHKFCLMDATAGKLIQQSYRLSKLIAKPYQIFVCRPFLRESSKNIPQLIVNIGFNTKNQSSIDNSPTYTLFTGLYTHRRT